MAEFEVKIVKIDDVSEHPNADRLTLVKIGGYTCIANKKEDGSWRYQKGDLVAYIPENSVLPEWLLKRLDMWNEEKDIGYLSGSKGNRVKAIKLRGTFSEGILFPVRTCV
jgi:RNA ligase (TIGR02306 family)